VCLALAGLAATGLFMSQVLGAANSSLADLLSGQAPLGLLLGTRLGTAWIGRLATLAGLAVIASDIGALTPHPGGEAAGVAGEGLWSPFVLFGSLWLAAQLLFFNAISSHSAALSGSGPWLTLPVLADWAHLLAVSAWTGGLVQFVITVPRALRQAAGPEERAALLRRVVLHFSTLAAFCVGVMLLSGLYLASLHVGGWERLAGTEYGRMLVIKLGLALVMLALGGINLRWIRPALSPSSDPSPSAGHSGQESGKGARAAGAAARAFWPLVTAEALIGLAVLVASARLTELPRGADAASIGPGPLSLSARAGGLPVRLTISPARQGPNQFEVDLGRGNAGASVSLRFASLDRAVGSTEVLLEETTPGRYSASNSTLNVPGAWLVEVSVRRADAYDVFAAFEVVVRLEGWIDRPRPEGMGLSRILIPFAGLMGGLALVAGATGWVLVAGRAASGRLAYYALLLPAVVAALAGANLLRRFFFETTPGSLLANPVPPDALSLSTGQGVYLQKCAECHGIAGGGDGAQAANLDPRPPRDFRSGRAATASDGDLYWWIKHGVAGSGMPAFGGALTDEQIWSTVNYLRSLGAGTEAAGAPAPLAPTPTPVGGPLPAPGQSQDEAITLLDQAEVAMSELTYLREEQLVSDDTGRTAKFTYLYAAPDRLAFTSSLGQETIVVGATQYYRAQGGEWNSSQGAQAYAFPPTHGYTQNAVGAVYEGTGMLDGRLVEIVAYADALSPAAYRLWIDSQSKRIVQLAMAAPNHHMLSRYSDFDEPVQIEPPVAGN
jgi:putative copper export protein/mono/diheme cytochrome c family protein